MTIRGWRCDVEVRAGTTVQIYQYGNSECVTTHSSHTAHSAGETDITRHSRGGHRTHLSLQYCERSQHTPTICYFVFPLQFKTSRWHYSRSYRPSQLCGQSFLSRARKHVAYSLVIIYTERESYTCHISNSELIFDRIQHSMRW